MKVYKINANYKPDHYMNGRHINLTGHWILANNPEEAIRIADKHKIGWPIGSDKILEHKHIEHAINLFNHKRKYNGKVWTEIEGKLIGYDTPFALIKDKP